MYFQYCTEYILKRLNIIVHKLNLLPNDFVKNKINKYIAYCLKKKYTLQVKESNS